MNSLSWLIYFAEVFGSLKFFILAFSILCLAGLFSRMLWVIRYNSDNREYSAMYKGRPDVKNYKNNFLYFVFCAVGILISSFVPSKQTIYLIAASEIGEQAVNSQIGQKVQTIINQKLDEMITQSEGNNQNEQR
jgi:hypothetical protein